MKAFLSGRLEEENDIFNPLEEKLSYIEALTATLKSKVKRRLEHIKQVI